MLTTKMAMVESGQRIKLDTYRHGINLRTTKSFASRVALQTTPTPPAQTPGTFPAILKSYVHAILTFLFTF